MKISILFIDLIKQKSIDKYLMNAKKKIMIKFELKLYIFRNSTLQQKKNCHISI